MEQGNFEFLHTIFAAGSSALIEVLSLYFIVPFASSVVILRFLFRLRGRILSLFIGVAGFVCFLFLVKYGFPSIAPLYYQKVNI